jgi:hypothetical protein
MAETPCGSVHESPVRPLPHAPKRKATKTRLSSGNLGLLAEFLSARLDSNLKHWETLLQVTCRGASWVANSAFSRLYTSSA